MRWSSPSRVLASSLIATLLPAAGLAILALGGCASRTPAPIAGHTAFELGSYSRPVTTKSRDAQRLFDQGLIWTYSFNHDEAIRSFTAATTLDPQFAMAYWGIALCNGPHINFPMMLPEQSAAAWEAITKAQQFKGQASPLEQQLIEALATRYANPAPSDRSALDKAYAASMRKVYANHRDDPDVATLYAEAEMDLLPWDLYSIDGEPREMTPTILDALERALEVSPNHPGANHYYIHACEASHHPEKADAAATRLRTLVPGSGHMVHMPSHIDVRLGRWNLAVEQNGKATQVDKEYRRLSPNQGFYRLYMAHDDHFRAWACMMTGQREESIKAARKMIAEIPEDFAKANAPFVDAYTPIAIESLMRFGEWDALLTEPMPPEHFPITIAFWHAGRAAAYAANGRIEDAKSEQAEFAKRVAALPEGTMMAQNPAAKVLDIAGKVLEGEIAFREGDHGRAIERLTEAVKVEDTLRYMEPPDYLRPARHVLGAVQLAAGKNREALETYDADLKAWPNNGWSRYGRMRALEALGRTEEAVTARKEFEATWREADTAIHATCLCVPTASAMR